MTFWSWMRSAAVFVISPLAEKNPVKMYASEAHVVLSMSRIAVATFLVVDAIRLAHVTAIGWPEATLAIGIVFALPILRALDKVSPHEVLAFGAGIISRFGVGDVAQPPFPGMDQNEHGLDEIDHVDN